MPEQNIEISPQEYYQLLKKLAYEGKGYGKTSEVFAFQLPPVLFLTTTGNYEDEAENKIGHDPVCIVFEKGPINNQQYPDRKTCLNALDGILKRWESKAIGERDISSRDFKGPSVYISKVKNVFEDYLKKPLGLAESSEADLYTPNPDATRAAIFLEQDTVMAAAWGANQFVAKGGSIAIRERDLPALMEAINVIESSGATDEIILNTLYKTNAEGERVAAFDAYPMEGPTERNPEGFLLKNYKEKPLKDATGKLRTESQAKLAALQLTSKEKDGVISPPQVDVLNARISSVSVQEMVAIQAVALKPFPLSIAFFQKDEDTFESVERVQPPMSKVVPLSFVSKVKYAILDRSQEQAINGPTKADAFYEILNKEGINPNANTRPRDVPPGDLPQYNATAVYTNKEGRLVMDISVKEALEKKYALNFTDDTSNLSGGMKKPFPIDMTFIQDDRDTYRSEPMSSGKRDSFFSLIRGEGIDPNAHTRARDVPPEDMGRYSHYHEQAAFIDKDGRIAIDVSVLNKLEEKYTLNVKELPPWHPQGRSMHAQRTAQPA